MSSAYRSTAITTTARKYFDLERLRSGQEKAIHSLLAGRDTPVVIPTGAGNLPSIRSVAPRARATRIDQLPIHCIPEGSGQLD